jgi:hypothetical protein
MNKPEAPAVPNGEAPASRQMFIVRLWEEASRERPGAWRGSVDHVGSGQRFYFARLDEMQAFIRSALDRGEAGSSLIDRGDRS